MTLKLAEINLILLNSGYIKIDEDTYIGDKINIRVSDKLIHNRVCLLTTINKNNIYTIYRDSTSLYNHINRVNESNNM